MRNVPSIPEMEPFNIILDIYINQPFLKNNLWYEIKANPRLHFRTMVLLARLQEDLDIGGFQAFPISRSWIPAYVTFDLKVLSPSVLRHSSKIYSALAEDAEASWQTIFATGRTFFLRHLQD